MIRCPSLACHLLRSHTSFLLTFLHLSHTLNSYQFKSISLSLAKGQKVGLVGVNGCGKSTLLKCIGGAEKAESGEIETLKGLKVVYVDQEPEFASGLKVRDVMFSPSGSPAMAAVWAYNKASDALASGTEEAYDKFNEASQQMDVTGGWEAETIANQIYTQLNVVDLQDKLCDTLSGGQRKRLGLATALVQKPDVILLDEPSNHLDIDAIEWLENHLASKAVTAIVVTHDRYFLETVCQSEIWELEDAALYRHTGNYESFLEAKEVRLSSQSSARANDLKKLQKELAWMRKQPRARQAKSKSREGAYHELVKKTAKKEEIKSLSLEAAKSRLGTFILSFDDASFRFQEADKQILEGFTYEFVKGDRIGIVGPNGAGKSTFLSILLGQLKLDSGEVIQGETVRFGYYAQAGMEFPEGVRLLEYVKQTAEDALAKEGSTVSTDVEGNISVTGPSMSGEALARQLLTRFQFPTSRWQDLVSKMSGGEKRRLQLMWVLAQRPNLLVLDEPSNDLDLSTLAVLEEFLCEEYKGVLVFVSHDRRFVDRLAGHLFVFQGDGIVRDFQGSFSEWLQMEKEAKGQFSSSSSSSGGKGGGGGGGGAAPATKAAMKGLSGKEKKELGGMEKAIATLQKQAAEYQTKLDDGGKVNTGYTQLAEWTARLEKINEEIAVKEERWMELMERADA